MDSHQSLLLLSPAWPWASPLTSVSLCFLICKMGWYWFRLYRKCSKRWCTVWNSTFSFSSVTQLRPTLCNPMDCSMPGFPVHHQLPELAQTHVHWVGDAIPPSHPLSSPFLPVFNLSQHQGLFQWVDSSHQVAKVLELQLQHQSFQWIFRTDFLEDWLVWSPCWPRDSQESSSTPQFKGINFLALSLLYSQLLQIYMTTVMEWEMTTYSSILASKVPMTEEPGGLQSMGSQKIGHDWANANTHTHLWNHHHDLHPYSLKNPPTQSNP